MDKITWSPESSVGHKSLDQQHSKIIKIINSLIDHQHESLSSEAIMEAFEELTRYSRHHLEYEEALLHELRYPDYSEHCDFPLQYMETIADYTVEASTTKNITPNDFLEF